MFQRISGWSDVAYPLICFSSAAARGMPGCGWRGLLPMSPNMTPNFGIDRMGAEGSVPNSFNPFEMRLDYLASMPPTPAHSSGGCKPARIQIRRARASQSLFKCNASIVARPQAVRPTTRRQSSLQAK